MRITDIKFTVLDEFRFMYKKKINRGENLKYSNI